jgi:hypothetical protein
VSMEIELVEVLRQRANQSHILDLNLVIGVGGTKVNTTASSERRSVGYSPSHTRKFKETCSTSRHVGVRLTHMDPSNVF